jgi:hypothetical protein
MGQHGMSSLSNEAFRKAQENCARIRYVADRCERPLRTRFPTAPVNRTTLSATRQTVVFLLLSA